ncbi:hypothetical protein HHK36_012208 [Tetracentron sinense]|uniref:Uncharacterized protein n=1 Tax=Tetracentron sinense TaxID=13715 RepID=A0A834Z8R4_TETSI|nr:hypothetical protein HHK36_012208 [Tetracentron sinense]
MGERKALKEESKTEVSSRLPFYSEATIMDGFMASTTMFSTSSIGIFDGNGVFMGLQFGMRSFSLMVACLP